jgi:hypothetical protein
MKRRFWYDTEFIEYPRTIDLISVGIVGENGEEFYGINWDCNHSTAGVWVQENVIAKLPERAHPADDNPWMTRIQLQREVLKFFRPSKEDPVELWGYYSAYDHVALCWLFGPMINLPPGMPMLTLDIKQLCDSLGNPKLPEVGKGEHDALADARWNKTAWEFLMNEICPSCRAPGFRGTHDICVMCGHDPNE